MIEISIAGLFEAAAAVARGAVQSGAWSLAPFTMKFAQHHRSLALWAGVRERSGARRHFIIRGGSARPMIVSQTLSLRKRRGCCNSLSAELGSDRRRLLQPFDLPRDSNEIGADDARLLLQRREELARSRDEGGLAARPHRTGDVPIVRGDNQ
jgi:hypothetical protein